MTNPILTTFHSPWTLTPRVRSNLYRARQDLRDSRPPCNPMISRRLPIIPLTLVAQRAGRSLTGKKKEFRNAGTKERSTSCDEVRKLSPGELWGQRSLRLAPCGHHAPIMHAEIEKK